MVTTATTYDAASHTRRVTSPDLSWVDYAYDGLGRMVRRHESSGAVTLFFRDGSSEEIASEADGAGVVKTRYVLDADGGPVANETVGTGGRGWYVEDPRGNLAQLLDNAGSVKAVYSYDPFGKQKTPPSAPAPGWDSRLRFQLSPRDPKTGMYSRGPRLLAINRFVGAHHYVVVAAANIKLALDPPHGQPLGDDHAVGRGGLARHRVLRRRLREEADAARGHRGRPGLRRRGVPDVAGRHQGGGTAAAAWERIAWDDDDNRLAGHVRQLQTDNATTVSGTGTCAYGPGERMTQAKHPFRGTSPWPTPSTTRATSSPRPTSAAGRTVADQTFDAAGHLTSRGHHGGHSRRRLGVFPPVLALASGSLRRWLREPSGGHARSHRPGPFRWAPDDAARIPGCERGSSPGDCWKGPTGSCSSATSAVTARSTGRRPAA